MTARALRRLADRIDRLEKAAGTAVEEHVESEEENWYYQI
jgi:hypothetical protein